MKIQKWLHRTAQRPDGSEVKIPIRWAVLETNAAKIMAHSAREVCPPDRPIVVSYDTRTESIAEPIRRSLRDEGRQIIDYLVADGVDGSSPSADTTQVGLLREVLEREGAGLGIAVGAGTINDIMKAASDIAKVPYFSFGTAASMNGYTSSVAALYAGGLKITKTVQPALGVFAVPEIVGAAPAILAQAGLGDLCSKPYAGADAAVSAILDDKTPWSLPSEMVADAFEGALQHAVGIGTGEAHASAELMEALWISGLSMTVAGSSAPASGGEHLWSHRLDMAQHDQGLPPLALHGTQVGVACGLVAPFFEKLATIDLKEAKERLQNESNAPNPDSADFESWLCSRHQDLAEESVQKILIEATRKYSRLHDRARRNRLAQSWDKVRAVADEVCSFTPRIQSALAGAGAARVPEDIGVSLAETQRILQICPDIRDRHTILDLALEWGW